VRGWTGREITALHSSGILLSSSGCLLSSDARPVSGVTGPLTLAY